MLLRESLSLLCSLKRVIHYCICLLALSGRWYLHSLQRHCLSPWPCSPSRLETQRQQDLKETMLSCTFKPQLVSSLPWTSARQKLSSRGLTAGERMYSDAIEKRRDWQLHLQKLHLVALTCPAWLPRHCSSWLAVLLQSSIASCSSIRLNQLCAMGFAVRFWWQRYITIVFCWTYTWQHGFWCRGNWRRNRNMFTMQELFPVPFMEMSRTPEPQAMPAKRKPNAPFPLRQILGQAYEELWSISAIALIFSLAVGTVALKWTLPILALTECPMIIPGPVLHYLHNEQLLLQTKKSVHIKYVRSVWIFDDDTVSLLDSCPTLVLTPCLSPYRRPRSAPPSRPSPDPLSAIASRGQQAFSSADNQENQDLPNLFARDAAPAHDNLPHFNPYKPLRYS